MKARARFEAMGRRAASLGQPMKSPRAWPRFAREAFARGWIVQHPIGTLTTRARWAVIDGDRMRMVRAVEGRALMGFPDHYRLPANEATAWHLIGNAVGPIQAADVITEIRRAA